MGRAFPPLKTLNNTNLPVPASSFVGRERELADVASLLRDGDARLVTLTGPGGSGKTRLAIEAAAELVGDYRDGVFWVPLASLGEPALVVETIAQALGARDGLAERIGDRSLLLVLDNFEHVIDAAADLSALLMACRNLRLLVTSRELLRLQGEVEYPVGPLAQAEAEELFCARSRLPRDDRWLISVAAWTICRSRSSWRRRGQRFSRRRRSAIASRSGSTCSRVAATPIHASRRCGRRSSGRTSSLPSGAAAVRAARGVRGRLRLEAAEEIVGADVEGLQSLVDKSLVRRSGDRFWMLETIGELARERLEVSSDRDAIGRRHAEWCLTLAEHAEPFVMGAEQPHWLERLEDEHDNLRTSLDWFLDHDEPELAVRLAGSLWIFWHSHGHVSEARRWLRRALDAAPEEPSAARSKALDGAGYFAAQQGDDVEAIGLLKESLRCAERVGATSAAAMAAGHLSSALAGRDLAAALAVGEQAVALAREQETTMCSWSR